MEACRSGPNEVCLIHGGVGDLVPLPWLLTVRSGRCRETSGRSSKAYLVPNSGEPMGGVL